ncbi:MAG: hypothetical protein ACRD00_00610 [Thermoanaerobaculia bacterium]
MDALSGIVRASGRSLTAVLAAAALAASSRCASSAPVKPAPPDPGEEMVAALTKTLQLDAVQQKRTRELLKELSDRDDKIRAGWSKGQRVEPMALQSSHGQFEQDFMGILTLEQRRTFIETRSRLLMRARTPPG